MSQFILETLKIQPKHLADFTDNYHHNLLPQLFSKLKSKIAINRYEEFGVASTLSWFSQSHLTIYQEYADLSLEKLLTQLDPIEMNNPEGVYFFKRTIFDEIYQHPRNDERAAFTHRPFFVVAIELDPKEEKNFTRWYHDEYLPKTMADLPMWSACRRYRAKNDNTKVFTEITIYEADNEADLNRGFELLRAPYRYSSNEAWASWVGKAILTQQASSFRPILVLP